MKILVKYILSSVGIIFLTCCNSGNQSGSQPSTSPENISDTARIVYYTNNQIKEIHPLDENGRMHGLYRAYFENGVLAMKMMFSHGTQSGKSFIYFESSQLFKEENYDSNGNLYGVYKEYYENGTLHYEGYYKNGAQTGTWKEYLEDGTLILIANMKENQQHGEQKVFFRNGSIKLEGYSVEGRDHGKWTYFNEQGDTVKVEHYNNGILESTTPYSKQK